MRYIDRKNIFNRKKKLKGKKIAIAENLTVMCMKKLNEARERHSFKNICTSVEKFYTWMGSEKLRYIVVNKI